MNEGCVCVPARDMKSHYIKRMACKSSTPMACHFVFQSTVPSNSHNQLRTEMKGIRQQQCQEKRKRKKWRPEKLATDN